MTGLFYGDAGQLVAQLIGVATLIGFVFTFSFVVNLDRRRRGRPARVGAKSRTGRPGHSGNGRALLSRVRDQDDSRWALRSGLTWPTALRTDPVAALESLRRGAMRILPVPWRDPHTVSPEELASTSALLEKACQENPRSADLHTCLGMAYAMNYEVYKSMDVLEAAVEIWTARTSSRN